MLIYATSPCHTLPRPTSNAPAQATFAMLNWALRETVTKLLFNNKAMLPGPGFYALSYSLLAIIYGVAVVVPSGERVEGSLVQCCHCLLPPPRALHPRSRCCRPWLPLPRALPLPAAPRCRALQLPARRMVLSQCQPACPF